jgi:hypothetical protein
MSLLADFGGGNVSSDGGVLLLGQVDRWLSASTVAIARDRRLSQICENLDVVPLDPLAGT